MDQPPLSCTVSRSLLKFIFVESVGTSEVVHLSDSPPRELEAIASLYRSATAPQGPASVFFLLLVFLLVTPEIFLDTQATRSTCASWQRGAFQH